MFKYKFENKYHLADLHHELEKSPLNQLKSFSQIFFPDY